MLADGKFLGKMLRHRDKLFESWRLQSRTEVDCVWQQRSPWSELNTKKNYFLITFPKRQRFIFHFYWLLHHIKVISIDQTQFVLDSLVF
jgi:hypothetical protein